MIRADSCRGNQLHLASFEQVSVASRARTNNHRIRIPHCLYSELLRIQVTDICIAVEYALQKRYIFVNQYPHQYLMLSISRTGPQYTVTQPIA